MFGARGSREAGPPTSACVGGSWRVAGDAAAIVIAVLAVLAACSVSRPVLLPLLAAILVHFMVQPLVSGMRRAGLPQAAGAALVLAVLVAAIVTGLVLLRAPAVRWATELPASLESVERKLDSVKRSVEDVSRATEKVEDIAAVEKSKPVVRVEEPGLRDALVAGATNTAGSVVVGLVLVFFLLAREDLLLRKLVVLAPRLSGKKTVVRSLRAVQQEVSRYLLTVGTINAGLGVAIGCAMWTVGLPNPVLWGVPGKLIAVPLLVSIKIACDNVSALTGEGRLLGGA